MNATTITGNSCAYRYNRQQGSPKLRDPTTTTYRFDEGTNGYVNNHGDRNPYVARYVRTPRHRYNPLASSGDAPPRREDRDGPTIQQQQQQYSVPKNTRMWHGSSTISIACSNRNDLMESGDESRLDALSRSRTFADTRCERARVEKSVLDLSRKRNPDGTNASYGIRDAIAMRNDTMNYRVDKRAMNKETLNDDTLNAYTAKLVYRPTTIADTTVDNTVAAATVVSIAPRTPKKFATLPRQDETDATMKLTNDYCDAEDVRLFRADTGDRGRSKNTDETRRRERRSLASSCQRVTVFCRCCGELTEKLTARKRGGSRRCSVCDRFSTAMKIAILSGCIVVSCLIVVASVYGIVRVAFNNDHDDDETSTSDTRDNEMIEHDRKIDTHCSIAWSHSSSKYHDETFSLRDYDVQLCRIKERKKYSPVAPIRRTAINEPIADEAMSMMVDDELDAERFVREHARRVRHTDEDHYDDYYGDSDDNDSYSPESDNDTYVSPIPSISRLIVELQTRVSRVRGTLNDIVVVDTMSSERRELMDLLNDMHNTLISLRGIFR